MKILTWLGEKLVSFILWSIGLFGFICGLISGAFSEFKAVFIFGYHDGKNLIKDMTDDL